MKVEASDLATLPNAISATGFVLAVHGASHLETTAGIAEVAVGRTLDVVDGKVARATGQSSEFGASLDATLDKFAGLAIIVNEWQKDIAPKPALVSMLGQNILNGIATAVTVKRHPDLDLAPTKDGKYAMASQNIALGAYALSENLANNYPKTSRIFRGLGHLAAAVGVGYFGTKATTAYLKRAR